MGKIRLTRRGLLSLLPGLVVSQGFVVSPARGEMPLGVSPLYAADPLTGLALRGFDPVSYRLGPAPLAGLPEHEFSWSGVVWRFTGAANRGAFARDPEAYAPRLGGYDPAGVLAGQLVEADPLVAALREDRLYLFRDPERRAQAAPGLLDAAEDRWSGLRRDAAVGG